MSDMETRNIGAELHPPNNRRGWAVVLALPDGRRVALAPGEATGLLGELADAVGEWTRQTAAAGAVLALVDNGRGVAETDRALTVALVDALADSRYRKQAPAQRGA